VIISYNIGYYVEGLGSGIFGFSDIFTCKTFRQFSDQFRDPDTIKMFMDFAEKEVVPRSSLTILVNIDNSHKFRIKLKNCREYKKAVDDWIANKNKEK
jgi:hypothetical protein